MKKQIAVESCPTSVMDKRPQLQSGKQVSKATWKKRRVMNGDRVNDGQQVLTRQMGTELLMMKEDEAKEHCLKEEVKTEDEKEEVSREVEAEEEVGAKKTGFTQSPNQNADQGKIAAEPPPQPTTNNSEENMELELGLSQWGWTPWSSKEEQELWFGGDFSRSLGNPYGDHF